MKLDKSLKYIGLISLGLTILIFGLTDPLKIEKNRFIVVGFGAFILLLGIYFFAKPWMPQKKLKLLKHLGHEVSIEESYRIKPDLNKIGIIGSENVGKTTFKNYLKHKPISNQKTQSLTVSISILQEHGIGILDGPGGNYISQFEIVSHSDTLVLFLDHNRDDSTSRVDSSRLQDQSQFCSQVRNHLDSQSIKVKKLIIVLNKKDLWSDLHEDERDQLLNWFNSEVEKFKISNLCEKILDLHHSNRIVESNSYTVQKLLK